MKIQNAIIESASIVIERGAFLSIGLNLQFGGGYAQGFGFGYCQARVDKIEASAAGTHMLKIMEIVDVEDWSHLKGKAIRIEGNFNRITRIGHITKDKWYDIKNVMEEIHDQLTAKKKVKP